VEGKSNKLIARALGISEATVKSHVTVVLQVLGVEGRAQVVFTLAKLGVPMA
jgi:DNA-binding NarL/FixJ family response regulator